MFQMLWPPIQAAATASAMASNFSLISAFDGARFLRTELDGQQCCEWATCLQASRKRSSAAVPLAPPKLQRPAGAAHLWYFHVFPTILAVVISSTLPGLPGTLPCTTMAPRSSSTLITCCNAQRCGHAACYTFDRILDPDSHALLDSLHTYCVV